MLTILTERHAVTTTWNFLINVPLKTNQLTFNIVQFNLLIILKLIREPY